MSSSALLHHGMMDGLRSGIYNHVSTGSPLVDMLLVSLLFMLLNSFFDGFKNGVQGAKNWLGGWFTSYSTRGCVTLELNAADRKESTRCSVEMEAMMTFVYDQLKLSTDVHFLETNIYPNYPSGQASHKRRLYFMKNQNYKQLTPDVWVRCHADITKEKSTYKGGMSVSTHSDYTIYLQSKTLTLEQLTQFSVKVKEDHIERWTKANAGTKYLVEYMKEGSSGNLYSVQPFQTFRTLKNVFIDDWQELWNTISHFRENVEWYQKKGLPHQLGILLHGPPGCGKTSIIKALANEFSYHVMSVNMSRIKTVKQLTSLFYDPNCYSESKHGYEISVKERILVMEDIDCMGDLVLDRAADKVKDTSDTDGDADKTGHLESLMAALVASKKDPGGVGAQYQSVWSEPKVTLATLLNAMDGLAEAPGRVIIMTTNHPERLDPALIRPGRIDLRLHLQKASGKVFHQMYEWFYERTLPQPCVQRLPELHRKHSQAEIMSIFKLYYLEPDKALQHFFPQ